jgi:hypothetical protein
MANPEHLAVLRGGSAVWNRWRAQHPDVVPDLGQAHLREGRLSGANLNGADLRLAYFGRADLSGADLRGADLSATSLRRGYFAKARLEGTKLIGADLRRADFTGARLARADLSGAYLEAANLTGADLRGARLVGADLRLAAAVDADLRAADMTGSQVYGVSAWNVALDGATQRNLVITPAHDHVVTTDNLQVAQFLYLLLENRAVRDVIETVGRKAVLILGRFAADRKETLEAIRGELRRAGLVPILFDFDGPANRDITETVSTLAHLARAVVADLTDARSVPQELMRIVPTLPSVPVLPIVAEGYDVYPMFEHFARYPWVRDVFAYHDADDLLAWLRSSLGALASA